MEWSPHLIRDQVSGRFGLVVAALVGLALVLAPGARAQEPTTNQAAPSQAVREPLSVSPGGAFLRAVVMPGWGHVAIGSYSRAGFYFAFEAATAYAFLRTRHRLSEAREREALRESVVRRSLAEQGVTDPVEIEAALAADATLTGFRELVDSREGHQEDLIAWGLFVLLLSGADAYVSAHLARFPAPIEVELAPTSSNGAEVAVRVALPNFP